MLTEAVLAVFFFYEIIISKCKMMQKIKYFNYSLLIHAMLTISCVSARRDLNTVVDLSHKDSYVDFNEAKRNGIEGVIYKTSHGISDTCTDLTYARRRDEAIRSGVHWGAYHVGSGESAEKQAFHFLKKAGKDPKMLLALHIVENIDGVCGGQITLSIAEEFVKIVFLARKRYPLIYGGGKFLNLLTKNGQNLTLTKCPLWLTKQGQEPALLKSAWSKWTLWQYTDGRRGQHPRNVTGIGNCSRSKINGDQYSSTGHLWKTAGQSVHDPRNFNFITFNSQETVDRNLETDLYDYDETDKRKWTNETDKRKLTNEIEFPIGKPSSEERIIQLTDQEYPMLQSIPEAEEYNKYLLPDPVIISQMFDRIFGQRPSDND